MDNNLDNNSFEGKSDLDKTLDYLHNEIIKYEKVLNNFRARPEEKLEARNKIFSYRNKIQVLIAKKYKKD